MQRVAVAVVDLARRQRRADRRQFVAGREEGDAQAAPDLDFRRRRARRSAPVRPDRPACRPTVPRRPAPDPRRRGGCSGPAVWPAGTITAPSSTRVTSCTTTVSAPAGSTAPVMMRTACPLPTEPEKEFPAKAVPTTFRPCFARRGQAVEVHRVTVHRRIVVRRHVVRGDDVGGQGCGPARCAPAGTRGR